jgi:NADPH:quinone reductase-like Zn-dependent oxidoreductase
MKALISVNPGDASTLKLADLPNPTPGPEQVVVNVLACAVNYPDALTIEDRYQFRPPRPFAPGGEISGVIDQVGPGVTQWVSGDRVIGLTTHGGMAEKILLGENSIVRLPEGRSFEDGAAFFFTYGTAIHALKDRGRIKPGDRLLVLGAAGGIGLSGVELGKALGATVVAAVSSEAKAEAVRKAGADAVVIYPSGALDKDQSKALADELKAAAGGEGFDIVYDPVGGDYSEPAIRAMAWGGRFLVIGFPAGIASIPLNLPLLKGCDICGVFWGKFRAENPAANAAHFEELFALWADGRIAPRVSEIFPLDRGGEAIGRLASRSAIGKIVVTVGG